ncbi:hypothetical protein [Paenibacillus sp. YIM B09110]|uniref:hypothetical protein n=2 Tax=unclassified Paenibacillus TaxID=185978 RepID=UPI00301B9133
MFKLLKSIAVLSLISMLLVHPVSAEAKTVKLKVTLVSMELVENNHVGNEWYAAAYVNGKEVKTGSTVTLTLKTTDSIKLKAYAEEQDKIPESGTATLSVKAANVTKTISKSLKVTVTENRGRYSGNSADWKFTFKIQK